MRVAGLDKNNDWTFGRGKASYKRESKAIAQNVFTRLRSFTNDWFLDIGHGIDWFNLLGQYNTAPQIIRAVERTVLQTEGVISVQRIEVVSRSKQRGIRIEIEYTDIFGLPNDQTLELSI
jgi:hypothetical protein